MAMRDIIYEAIMKGGMTREKLIELTNTTDKGLASQFTYLRMMGKCPKKQEDGTYIIVTAEEWAEHRTSSSGPVKTLTPKERVEKAEKREKRAASAADTAQKRSDAHPGHTMYDLQAQKAGIELQISSILLGQAESELSDSECETEPEDTIENPSEDIENVEDIGTEDLNPDFDSLEELNFE